MKIQLQILVVAAVASANSAVATDLIITETNVASFYREFSRLTKEPHLVAPLTSERCSTPSKALLEEEKRIQELLVTNELWLFIWNDSHFSFLPVEQIPANARNMIEAKAKRFDRAD